MRLITFIFFILLTNITVGQNLYRVPAEWEKQKAFLVSYNGVLEDSILDKNAYQVIDNLIKELSSENKVFVLVGKGLDETKLIQNFKRQKINLTNIQILPIENLHSMGVCRDVGPIIAKNKSNENVLVKFNWSPVGFDATNKPTNQPKSITVRRNNYFDKLSTTLHHSLIENHLAIEGGEIENNGNGVLILVESFTKKRNANFTTYQFDSLLQSVYGKSKIIWLKQGDILDPGIGESKLAENIYGQGMGGHIDEFARFVNDSTIFLAYPNKSECNNDSIKMKMLHRMEVNYDILLKATTKNGQHFKIVKIPVPDILPYKYYYDTLKSKHPMPIRFILDENPSIKTGTTIKYLPAASYLNFVFANDKIIIPKYYRKGYPKTSLQKDKEVLRIFRSYFKGKKIIQMDVLGLNYCMGGIHCWTQQVPE